MSNYERMLSVLFILIVSCFLFHAEKLELEARESVVISVEICSGGFLRLISVVSVHRMLSSLHNKV